MPHLTPVRPVSWLDVAASFASSVLPSTWTPTLDQARLDLRALLDGIHGHHEPPFRDPTHVPRVPAPLASIHPVEHVLPRPLASRYTRLRRDLSMVLDGLAGRHPPPFARRPLNAPRTGRPDRTAPVPWSARHLRVSRVDRPTHDAITLHLSPADNAPFDFSPGQFITLLVGIDGTTHRRAYSICSDPADRTSFAITVKRAAGGLVSSYLHDHAAEGMMLRALGPSGSFVWSEQQHGDLVLLAAGSGITPIMSILRAALARSTARIALLYGNRTEDGIIFRRELQELQATHGGRLTVLHVLSRPADSWTGATGHIDRARLGAWLDELPWAAAGDVGYYLCGPEGMMAEAKSALASRGIDAARVLQERFASPRNTQADSALPAEAQPMTVLVDGIEKTIDVRPGQTLLEAGLQAGLPFKFSCTMGGCGACKVRLRSGTVHMGEPNALTPSERDAGHALACIARPLEPVKVQLA